MTGFIQNVIKEARQLITLNKLAATAITVNQVLAKNTGGVVIPATSTTVRSEVMGIANLSVSVPDDATQVLAIVVDSADTWIADATNNSDAADNYQRMVLTDSLTVNNTGTDDPDGIVEQVEPFGPAGDKKIVVRFV